MTAALARYFRLEERGTSVAAELRGGLATFLTMAYILFANPAVLANANVPQASATACTAAAAGLCCLLMGFGANFPLALASGMGLNAVVAFQVATATGSWQTAMGLVVLDGLVVLLLVLSGLREAILHAIPADLRRAIGAGIGLFIAFIGLVGAKLVLPGVPGGPPVTFGTLRDPATAVAAFGLLLTGFLFARRVTGALLLGIAASTVLALALGVSKLPTTLAPPSFEVAFQADVLGALKWQFVPLLFALMMVDFFDTLGTASAIAEQAGLHDDRGRIPGLRGVLVVDSLSASIGGLFGVSSVTSYVESAAGVAEGARTGLHTVFVGLLFLLAIFAAPLAGVVPAAATAPALILVGFLMMSQVARVDFEKAETAIPAFVTLLTIPLTYSIAHGIGYGFLLYVLIKVLSGKAREVHPMLYGAAAMFLAYFLWGKG
jgi:AGZA family xanthine/uracil permease-like MFS transporter